MNQFALVRTTLLFLTLFATSVAAAADPTLPRHGVLGAALANRDGHAAVTAVVPGSAAQAAGLQAGDAIVAVDGEPVADVRAFLAAIRRPAGRAASLGIVRAGTPSTIAVTLRPPIDERDPDVDTIYGVVPFQGSLRRSLVTVPHGSAGRHPAVLIIGGIGCYSIDLAASTADPYLNLTHDLARKGFVAMRLEKSAVGDSQGPPCDGVDFVTEAASYDAALRALATNPAVDPAKLYLFGHSIGSIIAPRMAERTGVAGLIVAEGVGRDWYEYELSNVRGQLPLTGMKPDEVDAAMLVTERCKYRILVAREPASQILHDEPDCKDDIAYPVPAAYVQQVAALNVTEAWEKLAVPVLIIYGTADFVTTEADHRRLYAIVSTTHPGNATLRIIDGMDHYLAPAPTQQASFDRVTKSGLGTYDKRFSATIVEWLCARERCS